MANTDLVSTKERPERLVLTTRTRSAPGGNNGATPDSRSSGDVYCLIDRGYPGARAGN